MSLGHDIKTCYGSYPSGGGMFAVEHYIIPINVPDLADRLLYVDARRGGRLVVVREDVAFDEVESAFTSEKGWLELAGFVVVQTALPERSCVKYGPRGYRLALLEAGFAGQNLLLSSVAADLGALAWSGFKDDRLGELLQLDLLSEYVLSTIIVGTPQRFAAGGGGTAAS